MRFLPHAHRISLLSPAPVSHIFHSCRSSMPRKQKAALMPTPIKQSHEAMVVSYKPQTLHDTIHTVLPGEVLPAIPSYSEFIAVRLFVFQLTASRRGWHLGGSDSLVSGIYFNSQPHEEADLGNSLSLTFESYFNSQPHEEADWSEAEWVPDMGISTHSLTKRLTLPTALPASLRNISTHSLTKRLTTESHTQIDSATYFNSQPHEEADGRR